MLAARHASMDATGRFHHRRQELRHGLEPPNRGWSRRPTRQL